MKVFIVILIALFLVLQYKLWFEKNSFWQVQHLKQQLGRRVQENFELSQRNEKLSMEIKDLKRGEAALETHARQDLNMIKPGELFYEIVDKNNKK